MVQRDRALSGAKHAYEGHQAIAEAVIAGDVGKAQDLLGSHLADIEASGADAYTRRDGIRARKSK
jgi:DNA-binding GntR family transcriptional regulator